MLFVCDGAVFQHSAEGVSTAPKCKEAGMCLMEKIYVLGKLPSGMHSSAVSRGLEVTGLAIYIRRGSLNRNTHRARVCTDGS